MRRSVDEYCKYLGIDSNPLISQSNKSFQQCLAPFMDYTVKKRLNTVSKFNDKGRPENIVELVDFPCAIIGGNTGRRSSLSGDRSNTKFTVIVLPPASLQIGDILEHKLYGVLKVHEFDGGAPWGVISAVATRVGATENVEDGKSIRYLPPRKNY